MEFVNFDPSNWSDKDLDKLIELWTKLEKVSQSCVKVNEKIKAATITNDSFKDEIKISTDRCNEIIEKEKYISVESTNEIVELSKNIRKVRKQEDEIENEIAQFKKELVSLRTQRENIVKEINSLSSLVQEIATNTKTNINGEITIKPANSSEIVPVVSNIENNAIISTKKSSVIVLKSVFEASANKVQQLMKFLIDKINASGLVKNIENISPEILKSQEELDRRMKNYFDSIEAAKLAKQTEEELNKGIGIDISYIDNKESRTNNNDNDDEIILDADKAEEKPVIESEPQIIAETNVSSEAKEIDNNLVNSNSLQENMADLKNMKMKLEEAKSSVKESEEKINIDTKVEDVVTNEEVVPLNTPTEEVISLNPNQINAPEIKKAEEKVIPISSPKPVETISLGEKVDPKKDTIASAKTERLNVINTVFSKKESLEGVTPANVQNNNQVSGFIVSDSLKTVKKIKENLSSNIFSDQADIGDIFGGTPQNIESEPIVALK